MAKAKAFPVTLTVDYPEDLGRASTFFRGILIIPAGVILALVITRLFFPTLLMILFRRKYPRWWFDWNVALTKFAARVVSYGALLTDQFPSTEREQSVHIGIAFPDAAKDLQPGMPLVKWLLAVPHWVLLSVLGAAAGFCVFISWFAILVTGRFPRGLFDFVVGVGRWALRAGAYAFLLVTDRYPPFSLE